MELLVLAALIGLIPAVIAKNKGREFVTWWIYGALLFIVALPHSIVLKDNRPRAGWYPHKDGTLRYWDGDQWTSERALPCPHCAEPIKPEARVCRYCSREIDQRVNPAQNS